MFYEDVGKGCLLHWEHCVYLKDLKYLKVNLRIYHYVPDFNLREIYISCSHITRLDSYSFTKCDHQKTSCFHARQPSSYSRCHVSCFRLRCYCTEFLLAIGYLVFRECFFRYLAIHRTSMPWVEPFYRTQISFSFLLDFRLLYSKVIMLAIYSGHCLMYKTHNWSRSVTMDSYLAQ